MGTNYYEVLEESCPTCGRGGAERHIGKSSGGWCFALHVYPEEGINDWPDWQARLRHIRDEYGDDISPEDLVAIVTNRKWLRDKPNPPAWYRENHAERGPNGLARHRVGVHCIGHGAGTWDLIVGDFS